MTKLIKTLFFNLAEGEVKVHIYCNDNGCFSATLPESVAKVLDIDRKIINAMFYQVVTEVNEAMAKYKSLNAKLTLLIMVYFQASYAILNNEYTKEYWRKKASLLNPLFDEDKQTISFKYDIVIKQELSDSVEFYFASETEDKIEHVKAFETGGKIPDYIIARSIFIPYNTKRVGNLETIKVNIERWGQYLASIVTNEGTDNLNVLPKFPNSIK